MSNLTLHGEKRMRKRLGIKKSGVEHAFENAIKNGRDNSEFKGSFRNYLDRKSITYKAKTIVFGQNVYCVAKDNSLITVYPVPPMYRKFLK